MQPHPLTSILKKVSKRDDFQGVLQVWKSKGDSIVFTNGCFDIIHPGHIHLLCEAKSFGDKLVVALNSDASVQRLKGSDRPINNEATRALQMAAIQVVDAVVFFEEDTPLKLLSEVKPSILVKGGDYRPDQVVGKELVESEGGEVRIVKLKEGFSTTALVEKLRK